jgi:hypothetical protein
VLRRITSYEHKRGEPTGDGRKLHNEKLHKLYSVIYYGNQVQEYEMGEACSMHGRDEKSIQSVGQKARREETTWKT